MKKGNCLNGGLFIAYDELERFAPWSNLAQETCK